MNFRHKYLLNTIRIILGLFILFSGVSGFFIDPESEDIPENFVTLNKALMDSGIFYMIKVTEVVVGIMLLVNFLPWLAAIFLAPVSVGIGVVSVMLSPPMLAMGAPVIILNIYLGYAYWKKYKPLFKRA